MLKYMLDACIGICHQMPCRRYAREEFKPRQGQLRISTVTVMELNKGVEKSAKPDADPAVVECFLRD